MIGVVAQETARFTMFASSLTGIEAPPGSVVKWRYGWDLADAHNALIAEMLLQEQLEWIWFMADDHSFSPNLLSKLLARDLDLVVPVCLMRNAPYRPVNWVVARDVCENCGHSVASCCCDSYEPKVRRIDLNDYPDGGLADLAYSGAAGLLVKRHVFEAIEPPWFEAGTGITARVGEDINFCRKARAAGFKIFCDLDAVLGHCSTTVVWPVREADGWTFGFSMMGGFQITMPPKAGWMLAEEHA